MARGIHKDLHDKFVRAHEQGMCLTSSSRTEQRRLERAHKRGDICSPAPGVYALPALWNQLNRTEKERRVLKSLHVLHPTWVFADVSAAVLWGLNVPHSLMGDVHLATTTQSHSRSHDTRERIIMSDEHITTTNGIPVTNIARTAFDCLRNYGFRPSLCIADSALRLANMSRDDMIAIFESYHGNLVGKSQAIEIARWANPLSESGGESIARAAMLQLGFLLPDLQVAFRDPVDHDSWYRVDFFWSLPGGNVIGELDGRQKYTDPKMTGTRSAVDVLADERLRESHLSGTGARIMRFSYKDVMNPQRFAHILRSYGIPDGFDVPAVADPGDVINLDFKRIEPERESFKHGNMTVEVEVYDVRKAAREQKLLFDQAAGRAS